MSERPNVAAIKNLLICAGLYYLSRWVALPLALGFGKIPRGIIYTGDFQSSVLAPIVLHLPVALIASVVGASLIWLVDSARPLRWVMLVTVAYAVFLVFSETTGPTNQSFTTESFRCSVPCSLQPHVC